MKIIYTRPDGGVTVMAPADQAKLAKTTPEVGDMSEMQFMEWLRDNFAPTGVTNVQIVADESVPVIPAELQAAAYRRIDIAYEKTIRSITNGYPDSEVKSWTKQEGEARAWIADSAAATPWIDTAALERGITKSELVSRIIENADLFTAAHAQLTGKRQRLRDQIASIGDSPTQEQLDAIQWGG